MKVCSRFALSWLGLCLSSAACGGSTEGPNSDPGGGGAGGGDTTGCLLAENTTETAVVNESGCHVLARDTRSCEAARKAAGLSGFWLRFSCRVPVSSAMTGGGPAVQVTADGQPDYPSFYFPTTNACYEEYSGALHNPNEIKEQSLTLDFPVMPTEGQTSMRGTGAIVGLALNGVPIFGNFAAPGDDIFQEAMTFDRCGAHPQMIGEYHYHAEPYAISYDDSNFIGVMRDGYPIYGRKDPDGTYPALDEAGGHSGVTVDSPEAAVYHYHLNEQTSSSPGSQGDKAWFLTTGTYHGAPGSCSGCG